ncbi:transcriptional regulator [Novosphingobium album (ex Hu et al. 2023)]|uniref:Transcriptional regulator n=1 Tax=Novosphingobium album (ex Hu et al. 2023) TaxID=2930093 RepID=A0ABT0AWM6_9SPHN|nr:transcriptional regulator [Novosphingobium album (ex Hu et al. 2023)]MCJ2176954.1 transcriptional regulator [Novosphingobium album (ex Hu et al. 2023)]
MAETRADTPFAFNGLDRIFHERARLGIVTSLAGQPEGLSFAQLKQLCGLTDGNLNRHLTVLEEARYVIIEKSFEGKRPQTRCRLSELGRGDFGQYLAALESALLKATRATEGKESVSNISRRLRERPT